MISFWDQTKTMTRLILFVRNAMAAMLLSLTVAIPVSIADGVNVPFRTKAFGIVTLIYVDEIKGEVDMRYSDYLPFPSIDICHSSSFHKDKFIKQIDDKTVDPTNSYWMCYGVTRTNETIRGI